MRYYTHPQFYSHPGPICVHGAIQNSKLNNMCIPQPVYQSTPASISTILQQPNSGSDMDQGDIIDETIKQAGQSVNQTLLKISTGNSIGILTQNDPLHDNITNVQSTHDSHPSANKQPSHTQQPVSPINSITHPDTRFEQAKHIIMNIDTLSHSPTEQNKILQELNLHGLCKYSSIQQAYLYKNSNKIVKFSYILVFLKQSTCYAITPDTHQ